MAPRDTPFAPRGRRNAIVRLLALTLVLVCAGTVHADDPPAVPARRLPPEVVTSLRLLEFEFARALALDCSPERCFAKGCVYLDHTVVDEPAKSAMPGLQLEAPGPDVKAQLYLTTAECRFAHEQSVRPRDARALATRLRAKVSRGWTRVEVTFEPLEPLPRYLSESPDPPADPPPNPTPPPPAPEPAVEPPAEQLPPLARELLLRELWLGLLPHFWWMIGLGLLTLATLAVIWALRRLGRESAEEQLLLQQLGGGGAGAVTHAGTLGSSPEGPPVPPPGGEGERLVLLRESWRRRLARPDGPVADRALEAMVADLLRSGERQLLAKAVLLFPEELPRLLPAEGQLAEAKLELAEYIKQVDPATLPSDEVFFDRLERYALAASLTAQQDTTLIRSLHEDFGTAALVDLLHALPPRCGALLFALAPDPLKHEAVGLLDPARREALAEQLLRSNRLDPRETEYLLRVLASLRAGEPLPPPPPERSVSDRGTEFSAAAALSLLLPRLEPAARQRLVAAAAARHNGRLPAWIEGTVYAELLLKLEPAARNDLLLELEVDSLAAWLKTQTPAARAELLEQAPSALRAAVGSVTPPAAPELLFARADVARRALAGALRRRLLREGIAFRALLE